METLKNNLLDEIELKPVEVSFSLRILVIVIDLLIAIVFLFGFYLFLLPLFNINYWDLKEYFQYLFAFILILSYRFICIMFTDKTIGMHIFKVKYLNYKLKPLSLKEKLIVVLRSYTDDIRYYKADN